MSSKDAEIAADVLGKRVLKSNITRWISEYDCFNGIYPLRDKVNIVM